MEIFKPAYTRRSFLRHLGVGAVSLAAAPVFAEEMRRWIEDGGYADELTKTPWQTEGPFYPDHLPLDTDNDLVVIGKSTHPADGAVTHLHGRILDAKGDPIRGATIEIWQVDSHGVYLHSGSMNKARADRNFQGFGRFETASDGAYKFRTIKPVPYPGRTPHIHVKVKKGDREVLTTQCYIKGYPENATDGVLNGIQDIKARASVIVPFDPIKSSKAGELSARFDIVLALTPEA